MNWRWDNESVTRMPAIISTRTRPHARPTCHCGAKPCCSSHQAGYDGRWSGETWAWREVTARENLKFQNEVTAKIEPYDPFSLLVVLLYIVIVKLFFSDAFNYIFVSFPSQIHIKVNYHGFFPHFLLLARNNYLNSQTLTLFLKKLFQAPTMHIQTRPI